MDPLTKFQASLAAQKQSAADLKATQDIKFNKLKESIASMGSEDCDKVSREDFQNLASYLFSYIDDLRSQVYSLSDRLWEHQGVGHLPPLDGGGLSKLIKVAGMEDTYQVQKRTLYASADGKLKASVEK